ncbi:hypothetical protein [Streptomyces chartreusis]|uniref:Secreted protein n=1 Tax=Streptomyces chartreusis TaxID=1969 RepID=A0A7H8TIB4_STRCX|nr:hypothetical protein [Streptomyces chartreusis]QKZ23276.1 hypothetical protein HUT05_41515 [Streptomyces chartreusis]
MKTLVNKTILVALIAGTAAFGASGVASAAAAAQVQGVAHHAQEGVAYANAQKQALNQCPSPHHVTLVERSTWREAGGYGAHVVLDCS